jgi:hypothetical protein
MAKIFYQGTLAQYNTYQTWVSDPARANISEGGNVYQVKGIAAPEKQKATKYSEAITHPTNEDDYVWEFGAHKNDAYGLTEYTLIEAIASGHVSDDDPYVL